MINWYRAALRFNSHLFESDKKIKPPTLILWGAKDLALVVDMAKDSPVYCENGSLRIYNDATHWIHHEKVEEINREIFSFISDENRDVENITI